MPAPAARSVPSTHSSQLNLGTYHLPRRRAHPHHDAALDERRKVELRVKLARVVEERHCACVRAR